MPGGDPNLMTDDFAGHLTLEHRSGPRDLISFLDEPVGTRHNVRRIPHNATHAATHIGRGAAALRPRRSNMPFSVFSSGGFSGFSSLSPSSRESVDPIAELLSQLSGVRRSTSNTNSSTPTQLQQLQMQLQLERQQVNAARQQLERYPRRQNQTSSSQPLRENHTSSNCGTSTMMLNALPVLIQPTSSAPAVPSPQSQFLLAGLMDELSLHTNTDQIRQDRSEFVQELVLSSAVCRNDDDDTRNFNHKTPFKAKCEEVEKQFPVSDDEKKPIRHGTGVLRGRARSDAQNAKRRAEANRQSVDTKNKNGIDSETHSR